MTEKLYYRDAYVSSFQANILEQGSDSLGQYIVLDQTAFYPTGGGQPCDLGWIQGTEVIQVEEMEGQIRHYVRDQLSPVETSAPVEGKIDWERRFDFMQQHTGQHILSAAFAEYAKAETIGFHLGREVVTIDLAISDVTWEIVEQVERLTDQIIFENREIQARFIEPDELTTLPLRKPPTVQENIRIVIIPDFDYNPCGGTHPAKTGEVGLIKVLGWERHKGNVRLQFVCGRRTRTILNEQHTILRQVCSELTCNEAELKESVVRILSERKALEESLAEAKAIVLEKEADDLAAKATALDHVALISGFYENRAMTDLQKLAQTIAFKHSTSIIFLFTKSDKIQMVFARGQEVNADMNAILKNTLTLIEGKGGGNPSMAQGGGTNSVSLEELRKHAVGLLQERAYIIKA